MKNDKHICCRARCIALSKNIEEYQSSKIVYKTGSISSMVTNYFVNMASDP